MTYDKSGSVEVLTLQGKFQIGGAEEEQPHTWSFLINAGTKARFEDNADAPSLREAGDIAKLAAKYGVEADFSGASAD